MAKRLVNARPPNRCQLDALSDDAIADFFWEGTTSDHDNFTILHKLKTFGRFRPFLRQGGEEISFLPC